MTFLKDAEREAISQFAAERYVDTDQVLEEVSELFGLSVEELLGAQSQRGQDARAVVAVVLLSRGLGTTAIGRALGRHHSTIYSLIKRAQKPGLFRRLSAAIK